VARSSITPASRSTLRYHARPSLRFFVVLASTPPRRRFVAAITAATAVTLPPPREFVVWVRAHPTRSSKRRSWGNYDLLIESPPATAAQRHRPTTKSDVDTSARTEKADLDCGPGLVSLDKITHPGPKARPNVPRPDHRTQWRDTGL